MKLRDKIIDLVGNGYGIVQLMDNLGISEKEVIEQMQLYNDVNAKLKKRFKGVEWIEKAQFTGETLKVDSGDTPAVAALKAEATQLGVTFNPNIGFDKLKARVDEFKAQQQQ